MTQVPLTLVARRNAFSTAIVQIEMPAGSTLSEMIVAAGVDIPAWANVHLFVDDWRIPRDKWAVVRPKPGRSISLAIVPGDGGEAKTRSGRSCR